MFVETVVNVLLNFEMKKINTVAVVFRLRVKKECPIVPVWSNCVLFSINRRAEQSLFAQGHVKIIAFFTVRDILLCFISLNLNFSAVIGQTYLIFE